MSLSLDFEKQEIILVNILKNQHFFKLLFIELQTIKPKVYKKQNVKFYVVNYYYQKKL